MLQNNELTKKTNSIEKASRLVVKHQRGRSKSKDPKGIQMLLVVLLTTTAGNQDTSRKII